MRFHAFYLLAAAMCAGAVPLVERSNVKARTASYPFSKIVAFGDELSDNGNGSYAHGISGSPATVYGFGTWTNGPVAVSYLNDLLGLGPSGLEDYAFGGCCGGGLFGATLDNTYTKSTGGAQSLVEQMANYTATKDADVSKAMGFIWIGENDLSLHTDAFWETDPENQEFVDAVAAKIAAAVGGLLDMGMPCVFVANIYPKHIAPVTQKYLCLGSSTCVSAWGSIIKSANSAIEGALAHYGDKVIYYDSFSYIQDAAGYAPELGFTRALSSICDGQGVVNWDDCMVDKNAPLYFWMNWIQPTTRVHAMIGQNMKDTIDAHYGL